jgi:alpha-glucosidase
MFFFSLLSQPSLVARVDAGLYRFDAGLDAQRDALPSFALLRPLKGRAVGAAPFEVSFGTEKDRRTAHIAVPAGTDLYGTGEIAGALRRNDKVTECWNTDAYGANERWAGLYQSHPWVLGVRPDGTAFGVLADTTYRCRIDLRNGATFAAEGPAFPVYVIDRKSPEEVLKELGRLTGRMELPPLWALGYHQCRFSYMDQAEGLAIAKGFREHRIPCDTIWFDIDYMDGYRVFTFDKKRFPEPKTLTSALSGMGFHNVFMIDPGVKADPGYGVYDSGVKADAYVKSAEGGDQLGKVWPGVCAFPDFTRPETRAWWAGLYQPFMANGVSGVWNDMNEPSFFESETRTMPEDARHRGGGGLTADRHQRYHNVFGRLMVEASYDGILAANPDKRPFLLTRSGYLGYQRFAATWTGDNFADWGGMRNGISMILNLGLSGQPFSGPDIGGFLMDGPGDPAERSTFYARWWGLGSLLPFSRGHAVAGSIRKEPWALGEHVEKVARAALERRYRLLPYLYTQFQNASVTGVPVARPLFFADPKNRALRAEDHGFLLGPDLAVQAPLDAPGHHVELGWKAVPSLVPGDDDADQAKLEIRPGAIVPLGDTVQYVGEKPLDHLTLIVALDGKGEASGRMYEDAGDGFGYRKGDFRLSRFSARRRDGGIEIRSGKAEGRRKGQHRPVTVLAYLDGRWVKGEGTEGSAFVIRP